MKRKVNVIYVAKNSQRVAHFVFMESRKTEQSNRKASNEQLWRQSANLEKSEKLENDCENEIRTFHFAKNADNWIWCSRLIITLRK